MQKKLNNEVKKSNQFHNIYCLNNVIKPTNFSNQEVFYQFDGTLKISYYRSQETSGVITFKLPESVMPHRIKKIHFLNSSRSKVSWGSTWSRLGDIVAYQPLLKTKFVDYASNSTICNLEALAFPEDMIKVMWLKQTYMSAVIRCNQFVWFNWFYYKGDYYIQIVYEQYVETWGSLIGGAVWLNLGTQLLLEI